MTLTDFFFVLMYEVIKITFIPILCPFLKPRSIFFLWFDFFFFFFLVLKSNLSYPYSEIGITGVNHHRLATFYFSKIKCNILIDIKFRSVCNL